ncbi:ABC transporter substrate-binding protein [Paenibacillus hodogayensis]|uniref:ABC transporter substrate-binding protein n=1 Tax=Paenibacillus hodogayensis TaxID=279208 RepID=A0ABV5VZV1_9BACL
MTQAVRNCCRSVRLPAIAVLMLAVLLTACGTKPETDTKTTAPAVTNGAASTDKTSANGSTAAKPQMRMFTDDLGRKVEIPVAPQRIVVSDFSAEMLAVGVKPIAAGNNDFKIVFTQSQMNGVGKIGDPPNAENILQLDPDLIVMSTIAPQIYPKVTEQLEKIAPIVYFSFEQDPIYETFPKIADAVGKPQEAKAWIEGYEKERKQAQEQVKAAIGDETVSVFRIEKGRLRVYLNRNFAGYTVRTALQTKPPAAVAAELAKAKYGSAVEISLEKLPEYAADHLFVIVRGQGDDQGAFKEIEQSAIWKSLPAVQKGRLYFIDTDTYYGVDIATIRQTMKEASSMLTKGAGK